ncbi:hypothetical protein Pflav_056950 [Phytohabitans flavus]|uniref:Enoyl reductase (ER) domain-containing protein n=1 Tax=Phytohabitans flavus TaxID=1076124 RepID=A0A6F8XZN2_9ACTN|nr:hypothetical protein Pflav_056950 [Phytohabitans flavus]
MQQIVDAALADDATAADFGALPVPESFRGAVVLKDEVDMFDGLATRDKDPRKSMHIYDVPTPEPGPGEVLIAVMASSINYNTVWSAIFEPMATFRFLERYARVGPWAARHDRPYHVLGSDLSGIVLRTGAEVRRWRPGDRIVAHCLSVELAAPDGHDDTMLDPEQRIWGYETNYGGLAEIALVKGNQLMPKPEHLTWEEAAASGLVNSTAYRQLVSQNGAAMKQGDVVLVWGAAGGLGSYATQIALNGGAIPVCVVSSESKAAQVRAMGAELVINRAEEDFRFWRDEMTPDPAEWKRFGSRLRELTGGEDPDIVLEHPGGRRSVRACTWPGAAEPSSRAPRPRGTATSTTTGTSGWHSSALSAATSPTTARRGRPTASSPRAWCTRRSPRCPHWRMPARPHTRYTATGTAARSACSASPRAKAWA